MNLVPRIAALREKAQLLVPRGPFDYYDGGADDEITLSENRAAWRRLKLVPRVLRNISSADPSVTLFGRTFAAPLVIAPTAQHQWAHPDAECATALAAHKCDIPMCLSNFSSRDIEDITQSGANPVIYQQLYNLKDRQFLADFVKNVYKHGCRVIILTVDAPVLGNRERDEKNNFKFDMSTFAVFKKGIGEAHMPQTADGFQSLFLEGVKDCDWSIIQWIKETADVKVVLKGILSSADAALAVENGADGIIVSNHGGRQLDTVVTAVDVLPQIAKIVNKRIPILADGGIQRGTDIIKALAMGASAVLIGRPVLYALAAEGSQGIVDLIEDIKDQFCRALALCGFSSVTEVSSDVLF